MGGWSQRVGTEAWGAVRPCRRPRLLKCRPCAATPRNPSIMSIREPNSVAGDDAGEKNDVCRKTILKSPALYKYILETTVYPREEECLRELRLGTARHPLAITAASPDTAQMIRMLIGMLSAKNTIEIGVFTGYSLLAAALALPDDGKVLGIDKFRKSYREVGLPVIAKSGVAHKIEFVQGPAMSVLEQMLRQEENVGKWDFAFVDADKSNYGNYHEQLLRLVRAGGVIAYDNTLWSGLVAPGAGRGHPAFSERETLHIRDLNAKLAADQRVEVCQLSIGDGLTICRRR